jgi:phospholipase C
MRRYRRGKRSVGAGVLAVLALAGLLVSCGKSVLTGQSGERSERTGELVRGGPAGRYLVPRGIHKIKHVIVVMQENRSFDEYFGTYPGADGPGFP